ncbi:hypothetical protein ACFL47_06335 [Candidatus Latescibacterota bacterium]
MMPFTEQLFDVSINEDTLILAGPGKAMSDFADYTVIAVVVLLLIGKLLIKVNRHYRGRPTGGTPGADFKGSGGVPYGDGLSGIGGTFTGNDDNE